MTLEHTKAMILRNMEYGIIGHQDDFDTLAPMLAACRTEADVDAFKRTAERWRLAVEPAPDFLSLDDLLRMTAN